MEQIIQFLKNQFRDGFFNGKLLNTKDISDPIVRAINEKEGVESVSITNTDDFTSKIVEEQKKTTEAISKIVIPEQKDVDFSNLSEKIDELKSVLEKKELSVSVGETKVEVDTKGIISSVKRLQQAVEDSKTTLDPQDVIDYTSYLEEIIKNVEKPGHDFSKIEEILGKIEKKEFVLPLDEKGRVKVSIDGRLGSSGSRALSTAQETVLRGIATEETQLLVKSAIENITIPAPVGGATSAIQTDGTQKTQIVDAGGEVATVTGGKLDVNAAIDTTGLALASNQLPDGHNVTVDNDSIAVTGTFYQATQPVSVASLPLPTGSSTSVNQETLISLIETLQELAQRLAPLGSAMNSGAPGLRVTPNAATLPVSGTVTATVASTSITNFGTGIPASEMAHDINNQMVHLSNISNVTA